MSKKIFTGIVEAVTALLAVSLVAFAVVVVYANVQANLSETEAVPKAPSDLVTLSNGYEYHVTDSPATGNIASDIPLVLLHTFDARGSETFAPWIANLSRDFRVIVPDMLGMGYAERVTENGAHYSYASQAQSIVEMLDTLGVQTVDVLGHGYGSAVAAQLALDYPDRVRRVVFVAADVYPREGFINATWQTVSRMPFGIGRGMLFLTHGAGQPDRDESVDPFVNTTGNAQALFAANAQRNNRALSERLSAITQPVAVIWSEGDRRIPVDFAERLIADTNAQESLILFGGTHYPFLDNQQEVQETLGDFLGN